MYEEIYEENSSGDYWGSQGHIYTYSPSQQQHAENSASRLQHAAPAIYVPSQQQQAYSPSNPQQESLNQQLEYQANPITPIMSIPPSPSPPHSLPIKKIKSKGKGKENFIWKDELVYYLINKWQEEPVLYNVKNFLLYLRRKTSSRK